MSLALDIFAVAAFITGISVSAKRGFVKSLLLVIGCVVCVVLSGSISASCYGRVYESLLEEKVSGKICSEAEKFDSAAFINEKLFKEKLGIEISDEKVRDTILEEGDLTENLAALSVSEKSGIDKSEIKKFISKETIFQDDKTAAILIALGNEDLTKAIRILANENPDVRSKAFYSEIGEPFAKTAFKWLFAVIVYIVSSFAVSTVVSKINFINRIPVAGTLNTLLGGIVGALQGFVTVMVLAVLVKFFCSISVISSGIIEETVFFKIFYRIFK